VVCQVYGISGLILIESPQVVQSTDRICLPRGRYEKSTPVLIVFLVFISGCGANSAPAPIAVTLSTGATQALDQGQSVAITATVANDSAAKGVTWSLASGGQGTIGQPNHNCSDLQRG